MPMRWEDERYVRLYTRKTAEYVSWGWDGQQLFSQLLIAADRAGVVHLGRLGKRGVALVIGHPDMQERVLAALEVLLEDGVVVLTEGETELVVRNYVEAQEAKASDRVRKQQQRARDREALLSGTKPRSGPPSPPVTPRPRRSRKVTDGHEKSPRAVPSRAVPCSAVPSSPPSEAGPPPPVENLSSIAPAALRLWGSMQEARKARHPSVVAERTPPLAELTAMLKPIRDALGDEVAFETYTRSLEDPYAQSRSPCCPIQLFLAQWERHVPPVETPRATCFCGAAAEAAIGPGVAVCYAHVGAFRQEHEGVERPWELAAEWVELQRAEVAA